MRIVYVNHTGAVSGGEHSLLDLLAGMAGLAEVLLACPASGPLADRARALDVAVYPIAPTHGSLRLRPRDLAPAVGSLVAATVSLARLVRRARPDVIHANSIRAGLIAVAAGRLTGTPSVVHVRDRLPPSALGDMTLRVIGNWATLVVANSVYTADGFRRLRPDAPLQVVYNPVDLSRFHPSGVGHTDTRAALGLREDAFVVGIIGQITPWKGQREAILATGELRRRGVDAQLAVVGEAKFVAKSTRYDNASYERELEVTAASGPGMGNIRMIGERRDVPEVMAAFDAVVVPSWEEPFGRVVIEAMALGLPVVATSVGGPAEIIDHMVNGLLCEPRSPGRLADQLEQLSASSELRQRLGQAAIKRASDFALEEHVAAVLDVYRRASKHDANG